jgi:hypothetical protein
VLAASTDWRLALTARLLWLLTAAATAAAAFALFAGAFKPEERQARPPSFDTGPGAGLPGVESLTEVVGGVAAAAVPQLRARSGMETIMQDDAAFIYSGSDEQLAAAMKRVKELGVDRIRLTAGWSVLAPEADEPGKPAFHAADPDAYTHNGWQHYDPVGHWLALDRAVRAASAAGLGVMIDIGFWAPRWATSGDPKPDRRTFNIDAGEYGEFVKAVVRRYSGDYVPTYGEVPPPDQSHSGDSDVINGAIGGGPGRLAHSSSAEAPPFPFNLITPPPSGTGSGGGTGTGTQTTPAPGEPATAAVKPLPKVTWWTVWNEPNHAGFVQPQWRQEGAALVPNSPYEYRRLVDAAYPAIKGLQPDSKVLIGGTSSTGRRAPRTTTDGMPPLEFLRALACVDRKLRPIATGACADFKPVQGDGYAHHPYSLLHTPDYVDRRNPDNLPIGDLPRLTRTLNRLVAMRRVDPKVRDVYLTEFGYESNPPDPVKPWTPDEQARFINWAEYLAWKDPSVRSFPQFLLTDMGRVSQSDAARGKREYGDWQSGLYFHDGSAKPAASTFPLALHVDCTRQLAKNRGKLLVIWGHVRAGGGRRLVALQQGRTAFNPAASAATLRRGVVRAASVTPFATDTSGYFLRFAPYRARTQYRISVEGAGTTGLAVAPDTCTGMSKQRKLRNAGTEEF